MKPYSLLLQTALWGLLAAAPAAVLADEVEATFLVATLADGTSLSAQLSNDSSLTAPLLRHKEGVMVMAGRVLNTADVVGMRIEERTIEAIEHHVATESAVAITRVYNLRGQLVGNLRNLQEGSLPKGVYIVGGKKLVVR